MLGHDQSPVLASITMMELRASDFLADFAEGMVAKIFFAQDAIDVQLGPTFFAHPA
jgi:hypothetical protein